MSEILEKLYEEEQDTDAKFVAAAEFFVGLKETPGKTSEEVTKEAGLSTKAKNVKAKKIKAVAATENKALVRNSGAAPVKMQRRVIVRNQQGVDGQANLQANARRTTYKRLPSQKPPGSNPKLVKVDKPKNNAKVTVKVSSVELALRDQLEKEAFVLPALQGGRQAVARLLGRGTDAAKGTADAVAKGTGAFKEGYQANQKSALGNLWSNTLGKLKPTHTSPSGGFNSGWAANIPYVSNPARKVRDLFRSEGLVAKENLYRQRQADFIAKNTPKAKPVSGTVSGPGASHELAAAEAAKASKATIDPKAMERFQKSLTSMRQQHAKNLANYRQGMDVRSMTGLPETGGNVLAKITGPDGKMSVQSVMKGADELGLFNPATLASLGLGAHQTLKAGQAARAAAQKDKMMKWGLGGAAGLGALALLKNRNNN